MSVSRLTFPRLSYTGWGSLKFLLPEIHKYTPKKILVVADPILVKIGLIQHVIGPLEEHGYHITVNSEVVPEPPLEIAENLVQFTRKGQFDLVIGVGGGSALDLAKIAAVLADNEGTVADYLNLTGTRKIVKKGLPKIIIPTTSGTGSEVTNIAVVALGMSKDAVAQDDLIADVAIVDPELTLTVPPKVTAATGIDALTHAIEAYISVNASPTSDALALQAIRLIGRSIHTAVQYGNDTQARTDMSHGSYLAGLAFFQAGVAGVHALAYPLGGQFHISHGESNAVLLPYVMRYIRKSCSQRIVDIYHALGGNAAYLSQEEASLKCIDRLQALVKEVGIQSTLAEFNIPESALESLSQDAIKQTRILARSPLTLNIDDIRAIYRSAYEGSNR